MHGMYMGFNLNLEEWVIASHGKGTRPSREVVHFTTFLLCYT